MSRSQLVLAVLVASFAGACASQSATPDAKSGGEPEADAAKAPTANTDNVRRADTKARVVALKEKATAAKAAGRYDEAHAMWSEAEELSRSLQPEKTKQGGDADLARKAEALREKARAVRESGNLDDAAHLEEKAARLEKGLAMQREANDLERRAHEAKVAGRHDEAQKLAEECKRVWHESQGLLGGGADMKHKKDPHAGASRAEKLQMKKAEITKQLTALSEALAKIDEELRSLAK